MSVFSEYLSRLVEERNVKICSLYKYCGIDRSTMYQYISGKRKVPPSIEVVENIARFFRLTPAEYEKFCEAYYISKIGEDVYYRRKSVDSFIRNFPNPIVKMKNIQDSLEKEAAVPFVWDYDKKCTALTSQVELNYHLYRMLLSEAFKKNGRVGLFLQPDYNFLFDFLTGLKPNQKFRIEHLICMNSGGDLNDKKELYSLEYLRTMFPLYVADINYHTYYYYDDINAHFYNMNGLSCLILTSEYAITCTSDYSRGILYGEKEVVDMLWGIFAFYKSRCTELFQVEKLLADNVQIFKGMTKKDWPCYVMQPEPCLTGFITEKVLKNVLSPEISDRASWIPRIMRMFQISNAVIKSENTYIYFTKGGLKNFVETGRLREIPDTFYTAFSKEDRAEMLRGMLPYCRSGHYRIMKVSDGVVAGMIPENFHLCTNGNMGYLLFINVFGQNSGLIIKEQGILEAFEDYLKNLAEPCFMSIEESTEYVETQIKELMQ